MTWSALAAGTAVICDCERWLQPSRDACGDHLDVADHGRACRQSSLRHERTPGLAADLGITRSAAAVHIAVGHRLRTHGAIRALDPERPAGTGDRASGRIRRRGRRQGGVALILPACGQQPYGEGRLGRCGRRVVPLVARAPELPAPIGTGYHRQRI